jgi:hypothetical protein
MHIGTGATPIQTATEVAVSLDEKPRVTPQPVFGAV